MPRVDLLILANHAEVRDGLINLLGGGWNRYTRTVRSDGTVPVSHFGMAVGIAFETPGSKQADLWVRILSDDGREIVSVQGGMEVTEQTTLSTKLVSLAFNVDIAWPQAGTYHLVAGFGPNQEPDKRFTFEVVDHQAPA